MKNEVALVAYLYKETTKNFSTPTGVRNRYLSKHLPCSAKWLVEDNS
jgi:hypothetical protein